MERVLTQNYQKYIIKKYKNYSDLNDKKKIEGFFDIDRVSYFHFRKPKDRKKTLFFYSNEDENKDIPIFSDGDIIYSKNFDEIKHLYGDPFSEVVVNLRERSIKTDGNKVTITLFYQEKRRLVNSIYFKKQSKTDLISFDFKTGNFTVATICRGVKNTSSFRKNCFLSLYNILHHSSGILNVSKTQDNTVGASIVFSDYKDVFNDYEFNDILLKTMGFSGFPTDYKMYETAFVRPLLDPDLIMMHYVTTFSQQKHIKVPNEFHKFMVNFYPTEKYLKKNDRKLVASILDMFGVKSNVLIKLLHSRPKIDIIELVKIIKLFGKDFAKYVGSVEPHKFLQTEYNLRDLSHFIIDKKQLIKNRLVDMSIGISDVEKENIVKIINSSPSTVMSTSYNHSKLSTTLFDHFNMIQTLKKYVPDIHMKAKTLMELHKEHGEFSKMYGAIKKGWVIEYQFEPTTISKIEEPINLKFEIDSQEQQFTVYPKLLKREEEYIEEGKFMHHCVASYADKNRSVIVSFRTENEMDRVTCEFDCQTGTLIQARHFCNAEPPADLMMAVNILKPKVEKIARFGKLHSIEKKKVSLKINGIEIDKIDREVRREGDPRFNILDLPF